MWWSSELFSSCKQDDMHQKLKLKESLKPTAIHKLECFIFPSLFDKFNLIWLGWPKIPTAMKNMFRIFQLKRDTRPAVFKCFFSVITSKKCFYTETQYCFKYIFLTHKRVPTCTKKNTVPRTQRWQCWILKSKKDPALIFAQVRKCAFSLFLQCLKYLKWDKIFKK